MKKALAGLIIAAAAVLAGCSSGSFYGGLAGAGIGGLSGNATSGMLIGAGVGGLVDAMRD
jgi:hypothetical protein